MSKPGFKVFICFTIIIISTATNCYPQSRYNAPAYLSIGVKIGFTPGQSGISTYGFEASVINFYRLATLGGVFSIDYCEKLERTNVHFGVQPGFAHTGLDVGPTITIINDETLIGFSATAFLGMIFIPYYSYTFYSEEKFNNDEFGGFIKLPFRIKK